MDNLNDHIICSTIISPKHKSNVGFVNPFIKDIIPQIRDDKTASPSPHDTLVWQKFGPGTIISK